MEEEPGVAASTGKRRGAKIEAKATKRQNKHQWVGGGVTRYSIGTVSGRRRPWGCAKLVWLHAGLSGSGWGERERNEGGAKRRD